MIGTYTWDNRNRLEKVETPTQTVTYCYDLFDRRIEKKVGATSQRFGYDGETIALEFNDSNTVTHRYLHGPQVDQIIADETVGASSPYWPLTDHLGTVRDLIDNSGTVKNHIKYDTYGKRVAESDANFQTLYAFTGREYDKEVELQYHRARWYDPKVGRWLSVDPLGFDAGDSNLYRYVNNRPTHRTDPTGLEIPGPRYDPFGLKRDPADSVVRNGTRYVTYYRYTDYGWHHQDGTGTSRFKIKGWWTDQQKSEIDTLVMELRKLSDQARWDVGYALGIFSWRNVAGKTSISTTKTKEGIARWFGGEPKVGLTSKFTNEQRWSIFYVFQGVAEALSTETINFQNMDEPHPEHPNAMAEAHVGHPKSYIKLYPGFWLLEHKQKGEVLFHEFTHQFAGTRHNYRPEFDDFGNVHWTPLKVDKRSLGFDPVKTDELVNNAYAYNNFFYEYYLARKGKK